MPAPILVQQAYVQSNIGYANIALTSRAPTVGNSLFLICAGYNGGSPVNIPQGGWTLLAFHQDHVFNQTTVLRKTVTDADISGGIGVTYTIANVSDIQTFTLWEISGTPNVTLNHGYDGGHNGTPYVTVNTDRSYDPAHTLRAVFIELDQRGPLRTATPRAWSHVSPTFFFDASYAFHATNVWLIPADSGSPGTVTYDRNIQDPVWLDIAFTNPVPQIIQGAYAQVDRASATLNLPNTPSYGNKLFLLVIGFGARVPTPTGYREHGHYPFYNNNGFTVFTKEINSTSEPRSVTVGPVGDTYMFMLLEMRRVDILLVDGGQSGGGNTSLVTTKSLSLADPSSVRLLIHEWDQRGPTPVTPQGYFNLLGSDTAFVSPTLFPYHGCAIYLVPPSISGVQSLALEGGSAYLPVHLDLIFTGSVAVGRLQRQAIWWD